MLLPGSKADVDPSKFGAPRSPHTAGADPRRDAVDKLLLQNAYQLRKPVLGICYGLQSLNVYRSRIADPAHPGFSAGRNARESKPRSRKKRAGRAHGRDRESSSETVGKIRGSRDQMR